MADHCSEDVRRHDGRGRAAAEIDSSLRRHQQLIGCNAYWRKQMSPTQYRLLLEVHFDQPKVRAYRGHKLRTYLSLVDQGMIRGGRLTGPDAYEMKPHYIEQLITWAEDAPHSELLKGVVNQPYWLSAFEFRHLKEQLCSRF